MPLNNCMFGLLVRSVSLCLLIFGAQGVGAFDAQKAPFTVAVNDRNIDNAISFQPVLPNETLTFRFADTDEYQILVDGNTLASEAQKILWRAPASAGYSKLVLQNVRTQQSLLLQVFTLVPASEVKEGVLKGYKIGTYPPARNGLKSYQAPVGYIEVHKDMLDLRLSPHFTLGQFMCKQASGYPKFLVLRPRLLQKLELLLQDINSQGIATDSLVVMSGYRTPYYNRSIGNVSASRHLFGGAADVYVDVAPANGVMDDLNGDGKVNLQDATYLYRRADALVARTQRKDLIGGVGRYGSNAAHGPFVHVDVRGTRARWGIE